MNILQNFIFPDYNPLAPADMYFRGTDAGVFLRNEGCLQCRKYGQYTFDTYFNGFMLNAWVDRAKLDSLNVTLRGKGLFLVQFMLVRYSDYDKTGKTANPTHRVVLEQQILLTEAGVSFALDAALAWPDGMLYPAITALEEDALFYGGTYWTDTAPRNPVKLGMVITHFNRKNYILPAIARISRHILGNPQWAEKIALVVVDNSQNITAEEAGLAHVIPNQNLGGSGGFTRGLLYLQDAGDFTHCLFMDDDASCEIESILRTYTLLQYVQEERFAVAGALLQEEFPSILHEKGAVYRHTLNDGLHRGLDISSRENILASEHGDRAANFGAWWFFAFNIRDVAVYPYPFFVRGDDILFGISNRFNILTLSGIACWGDDFAIKENPLTRYLGLRSTLVCAMLTGDVSRWRLSLTCLKWFAASALSHNYASAEALLLALDDVCRGPDTFLQDMTAAGVRAKMAPLTAQEKMTSVRHEDIGAQRVGMHESRWRKLCRFLTLNGLLLPSFLLKDDIVWQRKGFRATFREIFRFKRVYYEYEAGHIGYMAHYDRKRFFALLFRLLGLLLRHASHYRQLRQAYRSRFPAMTSRTFWQTVYAGDDKTQA
ncbi:hypothetical protein [uncultured Cardiobacterium sp.]|uniref:hypothetical protein n=1 Tax=uncultured Cardiobacterium sp. TaxID=417619 RepID=UPI002612F336|nr:hypothetical protein [uncultured Cardiobacterium sp.]